MTHPLVLIERYGPGLNQWLYRRIHQRQITHAAASDEPCTAAEVEAYRTEPDKTLSQQPEAA